MKKVLIISAVADETDPLKKILENSASHQIGRLPVTTGTIGDHAVRIATTGPGQVNTSRTATACIENERPDILIQTGCAGAFNKASLGIGDLAVATEEVDVHLGIESEEPETLRPLPFPLHQTNRLSLSNRYPLDRELSQRAAEVLTPFFASQGITVKTGRFITVSTITATDRTADRLFSSYSPCMENMEGSAATLVALHYQIPIMEIRSASNLVGKRERSEWQVPLAIERCCKAVGHFLESL